jgi:uncharacterized protein (DUF2141 family)
MKHLLKPLLVACAVISSSLVQASDIKFEIAGINSDKGKIYIQLFKGEQNYDQGKAESALIKAAAKGTITIIFNDLAAGEYAVRFFHDEDNSGELETNLFGLPVEGYGFSNNAKPNFGPVSYSDIKFLIPANESVVKNQTTVIY